METLPKEILRSIIVPNLTLKCAGPYLHSGVIHKITDGTDTLADDVYDAYRIIAYHIFGRATCKLWHKIWEERLNQIKIVTCEKNYMEVYDTRPCIEIVGIVSNYLGEKDDWYELSKFGSKFGCSPNITPKAITLTAEESLLSLSTTPSGHPLRYLVRGVPLVLISNQKVDPLALTILNSEGSALDQVGILALKSDSVEITLTELSKGQSYFILQFKSQNKLVHEECVKSITSHTFVQLLRQQQKKRKVSKK